MHRFVALLALALLPPFATRASLHRYESVEPYMGTLVKITLYASNEQAADKAFRAAFDRIGNLDRTLSDYKPDSELSRVTTTAVGRPVGVSAELATVLAAAQQLAEATDGAFDVTQGPVIRLWRAARTNGRVPDAAALEEASGRSGYRKLHVDLNRRAVIVDQPGMALDVGAIGKGYAASEALAVLTGLGIRSALVAVSGDLAFSDAPPGQRGWRIDIHNDDAALSQVPRVLELTHSAISTSGASEQHLDVGGRRYSHIVDPSTGMGLVDDITVTVIASSGLDADGLDTAASIVGKDRGLALIESRPGAAGLIVQHSSAGTTVSMSERFRQLVATGRALSRSN